jgi:acetate kinase
MNTRSGSVDPGLIGWLIEAEGLEPQEVFETLAKRSGIAGLSGGSGDLREVLEARENGDADAATAFDVHRHSLVRHAGAMLAVLGGLDLLVFTGGVGEHQPPVRAAVGSALVFAGAAIDPARNIHAAEGEISAAGATARSVVVRAREDLEIARQSRVAVAVLG